MGKLSTMGSLILQGIFFSMFFSLFMAVFGLGDFRQILFATSTAMILAWISKKLVTGLVRHK